MRVRGTRVALPPAPVVHRRFEELVDDAPDHLAVVCGGQRATYQELNAMANRFAHFLMSRGTGPGARVGVCLDYSIDMLVAILGTLKSGAAYVPLDPSYPAQRLRAMVEQLTDLASIVVSPSTAGLVSAANAELVDLEALSELLATQSPANPDVSVTGQDLCYAVFTSGSTGIPKVAGVRHEGWFNLLNWLSLEYGLHQGSDNLVVSAFGFDLTQRALLAPLFCGATQHLIPSRHFDTALAYRTLAEHHIRTVHCGTSALYLLIDWETARGSGALDRVGHIFFGGEPMSADRVVPWADREGNTCRLLHQYGVAECTDVASSYDLADYLAGGGGTDVVPVGKPVHNTDIHIVDEQLLPVAPGEYGEICISGISIGVGYLNAGGSGSDRFVRVVRDGVPIRLYKTGDRGTVTAGGDLVVAGRLDSQVKVRGMRIDPVDVERHLDRLAGVRASAVVPRRHGSGEVELVAFIVPDGGEIVTNDVRSRLVAVLPQNMVPAEFITVPEIPLNPHGKKDHRALAERLHGSARRPVDDARAG